jgi:hypothetical protein
MRRVSTSEDAYVTQKWRVLRFGRCFVTLISDELTATPSLRVSVLAEGIGTDIVPQVLAATANGQFVWMKPADDLNADT